MCIRSYYMNTQLCPLSALYPHWLVLYSPRNHVISGWMVVSFAVSLSVITPVRHPSGDPGKWMYDLSQSVCQNRTSCGY